MITKRILFFLGLIVLFACCSDEQEEVKDVNYQLSTHILDINQGAPARDVLIILSKLNEETMDFDDVASFKTDNNGRISTFLPSANNNKGRYKLKFETLPYFENQKIESIYPYIEVTFEIKDDSHYHIPITVSANGYSTYRGS